jgi:LacI family repressor for deo operon, udp, cdd, tsx, nupC, and nupG
VGEPVEPRLPRGRTSILDVAVRAGVSPATVSRSLRGKAHVSPETRRRVFEAAHDLSYRVSEYELGEAEGVRRSVAVIVPFIDRWFFGTVTAAAVTALHQLGYDAVLYHLGRADVRDRFFARMPLARRVAGILTLSMPLTEEHTLALRALDLPLVSVGTVVPGSAAVGIDEAAAARGAVNHLVHLGHRRIGFLAGEADDPGFAFASSAARRRGWSEALNAAGLPVEEGLVVAGHHGTQGGAAAMTELLTRDVLPTAVFAEYDELAIGALWAIRRAGLTVPGDISVIGVDDHEMAAMVDLTTVAQDAGVQGETAARLLVRILESDGRSVDVPSVLLPTRLLLRGTTAPQREDRDVAGPGLSATGGDTRANRAPDHD